jgi:hypothetical protein
VGSHADYITVEYSQISISRKYRVKSVIDELDSIDLDPAVKSTSHSQLFHYFRLLLKPVARRNDDQMIAHQAVATTATKLQTYS